MRAWLAVLFLGVVTALAQAAPPVPLLWQAQGTAGTVYLLGSFHLLKADDYPLDQSVEAAYASADRVVFEVDPVEMDRVGTLQALQGLMRVDDGRRLGDVVTARTLEKLRGFLGGGDAALTVTETYKPWAVALNLSLDSMASLGLDPSRGLDRNLMRRATADGKPATGLETALEQMAALDRAPFEEQEYMLLEALAPRAEKHARIGTMHQLWRSGDGPGLERLINEDMRQHTPRTWELLARERNQAWLPKVLSLLEDRRTTLLVVGAMHLLGDEGLVEQLRRRGVRVQRVNAVGDAALDEAA